MDLLDDLGQAYRNEGKIEELTMMRNGRRVKESPRAVDHYSTINQNILSNVINAVESQPNYQMKK